MCRYDNNWAAALVLPQFQAVTPRISKQGSPPCFAVIGVINERKIPCMKDARARLLNVSPRMTIILPACSMCHGQLRDAVKYWRGSTPLK